MVVLSLFDGISCGKVALERVGKKITKYYASEIDKYAIKVSETNHPDIVRLGDVREVKGFYVDLLIAGSPCQSFSIAGNGTGFDGKSGLFYEFLRVLRECKDINPDLEFLLENVKMKAEWRDKISELLGVEPIEINSALVSAQNRKRLYWTNIEVPNLPEDRGLVLKDILETGFVDRDKSFCLDASYYKGGNLTQYFEKNRRQLVFAARMVGRKINSQGKRDDYNPELVSCQRIEINENPDKVNTLTTVTKDNLILYSEQDGIKYRKLTPIECERLQTLPDGYTSAVSDTQRYKCLGNGWTVDVIAHLLQKAGTSSTPLNSSRVA